MKPYLFSICIPTWNRRPYLEALLENIYTQIQGDDDYQIVIGDNNSSDNSYQSISKYFDKLNIKYIRRDRNIGSMLNVCSVLSEGDGLYCVLTGDDDLFREGWLPLLKHLVLAHNPDVISSNRFVCDKNMTIQYSEQCGPIVQEPTLYQCRQSGVLLDYLGKTESTSGFGFLSNLVIRQKSWVNSIDCEYVNRHPFAHMIRIMDILFNHGGSILRVPFETVLVLPQDRLEELMGQPGATDFDKLMVHLDGFLTAANFIFSNAPALRAGLLTPIKRIFSPEYRDYFPRFADQFGRKEFAESYIQKLDLALAINT